MDIYDNYKHPPISGGFKTNLKRKYFMATSQELFEQMKELFVQFETEHNGTSKASKSRARKHIGEIKKLVTEYRKVSVEENK